MKKIIVASILGVAVSSFIASSALGQGQVAFQNTSFGADALDAPVTYATPGVNGVTVVTAGERVGSSFYASLLYSIDGGTTWKTDANYSTDPSQYPTQFALGTGASDGDNANYAGYFYGPWVQIPGYSSGSISFIVQAYNGASYGAVGFWSGQSAVFTLASIATGSTPASDFGSAMQPFTVSFVPVPEPTTLALAGLGGLALLAFRRKQA